MASDQRVRSLQTAYVSKVVDTVNHLNNVFFEIANELHAPHWQRRMIDFIKNDERDKPKQHLVLMSSGGGNCTGQRQVMPRAVLLGSPADCFAVTRRGDARAHRRKPSPNDTGTPGFLNMDHVLFGSTDPDFVGSAFTRGHHFDLFDTSSDNPEAEGAAWQRIRRNVGRTVVYARHIDLANAVPRPDLTSTGFCLAEPGEQYVVYRPGDQLFEVSDLDKSQRYRFQWYDTEQARVVGDGVVVGTGANHVFTPSGKGMILVLTHSRS